MPTRRAILSLMAAAAPALAAQEKRGGEYGDLKLVAVQGKIVSLGEEMARKYGARATGAGPEKQLGLVTPEGRIYSFLDNEQYRKLFAADLLNRAAEVSARHFPRSMLLEITGFKAIPMEAIRRRFYCSICAIPFDEYGPCVCCGEEVQPVKD